MGGRARYRLVALGVRGMASFFFLCLSLMSPCVGAELDLQDLAMVSATPTTYAVGGLGWQSPRNTQALK